MNNDSLPRILIILFLLSFPLTLLAQSSDFVEQIELPPLVLAEQSPDDSTNDDPSKDSAESLLSQTNQKSGFMQVNERTGIGIIPRGVLGIMSYEYKGDYFSGQDIEWHDNIPFAGVGFTLDYSSFALDIYVQQTMSGKDSLFETVQSPNRTTTYDYNTNLSRQDIAINGSYGIQNLLTDRGDALLFSVGYKWGQTDINGARRRTTVFSSGTNYFANTEETKFTSAGPSIGITYGYPVGQSSKFGINLAYTWLINTEYETTETQIDVDTTQGLTVGAIWMGSITNEISYSLSFDYYKYEMTGIIPGQAADPFTLEERVMSLKASISYAIDL